MPSALRAHFITIIGWTLLAVADLIIVLTHPDILTYTLHYIQNIIPAIRT
jgi:hypothetical protein